MQFEEREHGMKISLLLPFYNEEEQLGVTLAAVRSVLEANCDDYEIITVDDGSKDRTWELLSAEALGDGRIHAIRFSRNFGKEAAICAAMDHVTGDVAILMDGDLQHPPRYIPDMLKLWREGYDVVEGVKTSRGKESRLYRGVAKIFYKSFTRLSGVDMDNASDFKLMDRKVVDAWNELEEHNTFFRGLCSWLGFKRCELPFEVDERQFGKSKWSLRGLWRLSINALTSFSSVPLTFITGAGLLFLLLALVIGIITLVRYFTGTAMEGFTTVILLNLIIGGATLLSLGLIGTYISRIYDEVKGRPRYLKMEEIQGGSALKKGPSKHARSGEAEEPETRR